MEYVLGLAFDADARHVLLIRKARPTWMAGRLNGVGGKIEPGEAPMQAMVREFREETGLDTTPAYWTAFARIEAPTYRVHCYWARTSRIHDAESLTDEVVQAHPVDLASLGASAVRNLPSLVTVALDPESPFLVLRYHDLAAIERVSMRLAA